MYQTMYKVTIKMICFVQKYKNDFYDKTPISEYKEHKKCSKLGKKSTLYASTKATFKYLEKILNTKKTINVVSCRNIHFVCKYKSYFKNR